MGAVGEARVRLRPSRVGESAAVDLHLERRRALRVGEAKLTFVPHVARRRRARIDARRGGATASTGPRATRRRSSLPMSSARTENGGGPSARLVYAFGEAEPLKAPPSICTSKVAVPSVSEKPKLTFLPEVLAAAGPLSMLGTGGATASTVQVRVTAALVLPNTSSARTAKVCGRREARVRLRAGGARRSPVDLHFERRRPLRGRRSRSSRSCPTSRRGRAAVDCRERGRCDRVDRPRPRHGCARVSPNASTARTANVREPSARFVYAFGLAEPLKAPPSICTSNVAVPSVSEKPKRRSYLASRGRSSRSAHDARSGGAIASTVQVRVTAALVLQRRPPRAPQVGAVAQAVVGDRGGGAG